MPAPLDTKIRKIIINLVKQEIFSREQIAEIIEVHVNTVNNIWKQYYTTGSLEPKPHRGGNSGWFLDSDYPLLRELVNENNDDTLEELAQRFEEKTGDFPAISTLHDALKRLGITLKKKRKLPLNEIEKT